jgi:osmoprotectant transport system ATP-binding protein
MTTDKTGETNTSRNDSMITFDDVTKIYQNQTVAIEDVSFEVKRGTTTVLVGPSGCGKTTTMTLVNRLEDPTEGTVYYDGTDVTELNETELRREIGYVIQEIGLFDIMTAGENVAMVPNLKGWDEDRVNERVDELFELMNLPPDEYRDQYPAELSGGQQQRVGVARALAADPDVLLMDEPFGALDPITREELQDEFLDIQRRIDTTILFVTHDINEALKMGDKIAIFDVGEIVQYGTPQEILENPANEFVENFIGSDRTLKELQVTSVEEIMQTPEQADEDLFTAAGGDGTGQDETPVRDTDIVSLTPTDSAQTALSQLLQTNNDALPVLDNGNIVGVVTQSQIQDSVSEEANSNETSSREQSSTLEETEQ